LVAATQQWIVPAQCVKDVVVQMGGAASAVQVVQEFINVPAWTNASASDRSELLRKLGIPDNAFVVGGSGTVDWRKGTDLFVQLAALWRRTARDANTYFVWVGGSPESEFFKLAQLEAERAGVIERVRLVPSAADPFPYYRAFDVLCLTSREDPFPLVCLEAAAMAKPIVCFDTGGMPEFVEQDAGFVVAFPDLEGMASAVDLIRADASLREQLGARARTKVESRNDVKVLAPRIQAVIAGASPGP
jgi:glycosyltransferase involved in cell wall biosynthesis